jgi:hypothetical protein
VVVPPVPPPSQRLRNALLVGASIVLVVGVALLLASTADTDSTHKAAKAKAKAKEKARIAAQARPVKLAVGRVIVQSTGLPSAVKPPVRRAVMSATQRYFDNAIQSPLRSRGVNPAYQNVFDTGVNGPAAHKDRAALTESATGPIRGPVRIWVSHVRIDGLGDPAGKIALVATTFTMRADARTPAGKLQIRRHTELTFAYELGRWKVTAYQVTVRRILGGKTTTTTARAGTGAKP